MSAGASDATAVVARFGLTPGDVVGEIGYDDDVDHDLRDAVEAATGSPLVDEDADEVVDAVLLWWREEDGDIVDGMVDALTLLADDGVIWLLTPKTGQDGYIEPSEINDAVRTAGLAQTTSTTTPGDWVASRLARAGQPRAKR